jgi:hypothetical protein
LDGGVVVLEGLGDGECEVGVGVILQRRFILTNLSGLTRLTSNLA